MTTYSTLTPCYIPARSFDHPRDVVGHPALTTAEKRAILASWASDASAIASCPALRAPEGLKEAGDDRRAFLKLFASSMASREIRPEASLPFAIYRACTSGLRGERHMEINLPRHV